MAILTTNAPNLAFQVPDLQKGVDNLSGGLQALSFGLDKYKLNKERDKFNTAIEEGYKAPGLAGNPQLQQQTESGGEQPQVPGIAGALAAQKAMELAAIRAKTHGVDTGDYQAMRSRQAQEEAEQMALADKNTMGAFGQLTENDNKAQTLFGNINAASRELSEYKAQNAAKLNDPMVKTTIKATEDRIKQMSEEYNSRKTLGDQMAKTLIESNQGRYGYINDYVNARGKNREQPSQQPPAEEQASQQPPNGSFTYTPDQQKLLGIVSNYKGISEIYDDTEIENMFAKYKIPLTQENREFLKKRLNDRAKTNYAAREQYLKLKGMGFGQEEAERNSAAEKAEALSLYNSIRQVNKDDYEAMQNWVKTNDEQIKVGIAGFKFNLGLPRTQAEKDKIKADFIALESKLREKSGTKRKSKADILNGK